MSSTARGTVRNANDYYVTPHWLIHEFLQRFIPDHNIDVRKQTLDPAAGGCKKYQASYPTVLNAFGFHNFISCDIRQDSRAQIKGLDYLNSIDGAKNYLIITNPPFHCSVEFTEKALNNVRDGGYVVMLQRLNWLGSAKRKPFWDDAPLKQIYVHHKRASFYPELPKKKDSIEYAHFVFQKGYSGTTALSII